MILCIGTTPAAQRTMVFRRLVLDEVNRAATTADGIAGKSFNVAKVLKVLGEEPLATGFLGGERGEDLRAGLAARGIQLEFVSVPVPTRQCITVIDESAGAHTELVEESKPVAGADYEKLMSIIRRHTPESKAVIMSGSLTPGGPTDLYFRCTQIAEQAGALSIVDAQGQPLLEALKARPGLVKPNRSELAASTGRQLKDETAVMSAMRELRDRGAQRIVVTAGKEPALAFDGASFWKISAPLIKPVNPIGSGDAFTACTVSRLLRGDDLGEACRWGSAAGAANALTLMAGEVERSEVERLVKETKVEKL
jgi:1-phosphofructokinase family hexose kinase